MSAFSADAGSGADSVSGSTGGCLTGSGSTAATAAGSDSVAGTTRPTATATAAATATATAVDAAITSTDAAVTTAAAGLRLLVAAGILWGTGGLSGRLLGRVSHLAAPAVAGYRLALGGGLLVAYLVLTRRPRPRGRAARRRIAAVGLLAAAFQASYFAAVSAVSVSLATLVAIGAAPVVVIGWETATGTRRPTPAAVGTVALALTGLALLVGRPGHPGSTATLLTGVALALAAATGFAAITVLCRKPVPGLDDLALTGYGFAFGGLILLPPAAATSGVAFSPRPASLALLLGLGLVPTALAYVLYFTGLRRVPSAGTATVTALLEPLTGTLLSAVVLGDRIGAAGLAGAALLGVSVLLNARATT